VPERPVRGRRLIVDGLRLEHGDAYTLRRRATDAVRATGAAAQPSGTRTVRDRVRLDPPVGGKC
jgi:hypothetical protein